MAKIYYVGDWAVMLGPCFAETPFNYSMKGTDIFKGVCQLPQGSHSTKLHEPPGPGSCGAVAGKQPAHRQYRRGVEDGPARGFGPGPRVLGSAARLLPEGGISAGVVGSIG